MHVQQRVEAPAPERAMHGRVAAKSPCLVEDDELDAVEPLNKECSVLPMIHVSCVLGHAS